MPETPTPTSGPSHVTLGEILRRTALPFALFGFVLLTLLLLSFLLLLPRFTRVELHGALLDPAAIQSEVVKLQTELAKAEESRQALLLPLDQSDYGALVRRKMERPEFAVFLETLTNLARSAVPAKEDAVIITSLSFAESTKGMQATVTGDVRNVGLNSMTVLAQFSDAVAHLPAVASLERPSFTRIQDPVIGFHSPFTFTVILR